MLRGLSISTVLLLMLATAACFILDECDSTDPDGGTLEITCTASPQSGRVPFDVAFMAQAKGKPDARFEWHFGDGSVAAGANVVKAYTYGGTYEATVTGTVGDEYGSCRLSVTADSDVRISECAATPDSGNAPLDVKFAATAEGIQGNTLSYSWDFGDGTTSSVEDPRHTYAAIGNYTARLTVRSGSAAAQCTVPVGVYGSLNVSCGASPKSGSAPVSVHFSSAVAGKTGCSYAWDFGDGFTDSGQSPTHRYDHGGVYWPVVTARCGTEQGSCRQTLGFGGNPNEPTPEPGSGGGASTPAPSTPTPVPTPDCSGTFTFTGGPATKVWPDSVTDAPMSISGLPDGCFIDTELYRLYVSSSVDLGTVGTIVAAVVDQDPGPWTVPENVRLLEHSGLSGTLLGTSDTDCSTLQFQDGAPPFNVANDPYADLYDVVSGDIYSVYAPDLNGHVFTMMVNGTAPIADTLTIECWQMVLTLKDHSFPVRGPGGRGARRVLEIHQR